MHNRSHRGSGHPVWVRAHQARAFDWDPAPRIALGPAVIVPRQQAGHMTAPDQCAQPSRKPLPKGSRPHMTQSRLLIKPQHAFVVLVRRSWALPCSPRRRPGALSRLGLQIGWRASPNAISIRKTRADGKSDSHCLRRNGYIFCHAGPAAPRIYLVRFIRRYLKFLQNNSGEDVRTLK